MALAGAEAQALIGTGNKADAHEVLPQSHRPLWFVSSDYRLLHLWNFTERDCLFYNICNQHNIEIGFFFLYFEF